MAPQPTPVMPGPCGAGGCPPPTEIDCIEVNKVFDLCFQQEAVTRTFTLMDQTVIGCICPTPTTVLQSSICPVGTTIPCQIGTPSCTEVSREPISGAGGFAAITLMISVPVMLFPVGTTFPTTVPQCGDTLLVAFTKRVTLCAPEGTEVSCTITGDCDAMITNLVTDGTGRLDIESMSVEVALTLCIIVKTIADVNLLVPSYGFCVPAECVTMGLMCPPPLPPSCEMPA